MNDQTQDAEFWAGSGKSQETSPFTLCDLEKAEK